MRHSLLLPAFLLISALLPLCAETPLPPGAQKVPVTFSGGYDTDPRDHGRPVILIGNALGVTPETFREAFSRVHPAGPGSGGPTREEAQANKKVLMDVLAPKGISNERLDEVSNYYRYPPGRGGRWKTKDASANAIVKDGKVLSFEIVDGGSGYSSEPTVTVPGVNGGPYKAKVAYAKQFEKNGTVTAIAAGK